MTNDWLKIKVQGTDSNRDGIGAFITVDPDASVVGDEIVREINAGSNFLSQNELTAHFGLGPDAGTIDSITVAWPSGAVQELSNVSVNQVLSVVENARSGDYNNDGKVDAADYTVWRDQLGSIGDGFAADGNDDDKVTELDYDDMEGELRRDGCRCGGRSKRVRARADNRASASRRCLLFRECFRTWNVEMLRALLTAAAMIVVWASQLNAADEPSEAPKPIPATRPEMKAALEALKQRQPRVPLPLGSADGEQHPSLLPEAWGVGGGPGSVQGPNSKLDDLAKDRCFWVISRGNNCHYCLGHQELKLRAGGMDDDTIASLDSDWSEFNPRQQAALAFARKLTLEPQLVGDDDIARLRKVFSDPEIIELVFTIGGFNAMNRWTDGLGFPHERHFSDGREITLTTPTGEEYQHTKSIVIPTTRAPRPPLATLEQTQQAIAASRNRTPRVALPNEAVARQELSDVIGDRAPYEWERALAALPENGKAHVKTWNTILSDDNLTPRLKAEIAFITAMNNQAWYAAAHAAHRLKHLGASPEDLTSLLGDKEPKMGGAVAAYRLAAKSTTDPHLITDADIADVRAHYSDQETAEIMQVICMANLFDRFTESLGLQVETGTADVETLLRR